MTLDGDHVYGRLTIKISLYLPIIQIYIMSIITECK